MTFIGVDTNVLLRMLVNDDVAQRERALAFGRTLGKNRQGFVSLGVLLELSWALRSSYRFSNKDILEAIRHIIGVKTFRIESFDTVVAALEYAEDRNADLADELISVHYAELGCRHTVTFDEKAARRVPGMELLA